MRIIVNGQQAFGKACVEAMVERGDDVIAVFCAPDKDGRPVDPIKEFALEKGLPLYQPKSYKDPETLDRMRDLKPDLLVLAFVTIFIPAAARDIPTRGSICFHPSLLPLHRGPSSINWPIMAGATRTGLTIFYPDDVVYFQKIFPLGVEAVLEAVDLLRDGKAPRVEQDDSKATYESWCKHEHAEIGWRKSVAEVYDLIRGTNPQPGAWTTLDGKVLKIYDCAKVEGGGGTPGQVIRITDEGFAVAAADGEILVKRVMAEGAKKTPASEFATAAGIAEGTLLGAA
jgi:methionyl-tRNA formyltransferase